MLHPDWLDIVVGSNLLGDILPRPEPALAPSASRQAATSPQCGHLIDLVHQLGMIIFEA
jgi:hypothetical protein